MKKGKRKESFELMKKRGKAMEYEERKADHDDDDDGRK